MELRLQRVGRRQTWVICFRLIPGLLAWLSLVGVTPAVRSQDVAETPSADPTAWPEIIGACEAVQGSSDFTTADIDTLLSRELRRRAPPADTLAAFVSDPSQAPECQAAIVRYISANRTLYSNTPDGAVLARAFLSLADSRSRPLDVLASLERGAASLDDSDDLMGRMLAHCHSGDPARVEQGVAMLGASCDARAADSLLAFIRRLAGTGAHPSALAKAMPIAGRSVGVRACDLLSEIFELTPDPSLRRAALLGLAHTGDSRVIAILLSAHERVSASGAETNGEELWHLTRMIESAMVRSLNAGDSTAGLAFELADRESRLGRPADGARLYAALRAWAVRSGNSADRADRIIARFNSYASPPPSPDGSALEHAVPIRPNPSG